jgi:aspartate carbamoyltransferase catalytic subunit
MDNLLKGKDILSISDLSKAEVQQIFETAQLMEPYATREKVTRVLEGAALANLFFEPSTRTRVSFGTAFNRLGGAVRDTTGTASTSVSKGESLHDTARVIGGYADVIAVRHSKTGSAQEIADAVDIPVINGGDGIGEHPTQGLLDVYTIEKELGDPSGKTIAVVGDLKYGRVVHSVVKLLDRMYSNLNFKLIAPQDLQLPTDLRDQLSSNGKNHTVSLHESIDAISDADIIYATRTQEERFTDPSEFEKFRGKLRINKEVLDKLCKPDVMVMHPLPRDSREDSNELSHDLDGDPRLTIFKETDNGIPVRMALFALTLDVVDQVEKTARPVNWHVPGK